MTRSPAEPTSAEQEEMILRPLFLVAMAALTSLRPTRAAAAVSNPCSPGGEIWPLERFKPAYLCIGINDKRAVFDTLADSFRAIELSGSFNTYAKGQSADVLLSVAAMGGSSDDVAYAIASSKLYAFTPPVNAQQGVLATERMVINVYTAIVQVEKGIVTSVTYDDGCALCGGTDSDRCVVNARQITPGGAPVDESQQRGCAVPASECVDLPAAPGASASDVAPNTCDLRMYVTWSGTDSKGRFFTSLNKRFSRFRGWGMDLPGLAAQLQAIGSDAISRLQPGKEDYLRRIRRRRQRRLQGRFSAAELDNTDVHSLRGGEGDADVTPGSSRPPDSLAHEEGDEELEELGLGPLW